MTPFRPASAPRDRNRNPVLRPWMALIDFLRWLVAGEGPLPPAGGSDPAAGRQGFWRWLAAREDPGPAAPSAACSQGPSSRR